MDILFWQLAIDIAFILFLHYLPQQTEYNRRQNAFTKTKTVAMNASSIP